MTAPAKPSVTGTDRVGVGVLFIVGAVLTMSFQDALVKLISADLPLWQIYVVRSLVAIPILVLTVFAARPRGGGDASGPDADAGIRPRSPFWTLLRGVLLVLMYIAFYAGLPVLDLSLVAAAYYTGPLMITVLSARLSGDRVGPLGWLAVAVGFVGVLVILRPGTEGFSPAALLPILSALFYALAAVVTRTRCRRESATALSLGLNYAFIAIGLAATLALLAWNPEPARQAVYPFLLGDWVAMGDAAWRAILILAVANVVIHILLAKAYQSAPSAIVATFDYAYLPFAAVWGYLFFASVPDAPTLVGMALIAGGGWLAIRSGRRMRERAQGDRT